jgi:hypothetical protein
MAPNATISVVEAPSDSPTDLFAAGACVAENRGGEVSMSWGFSEASGETAFRRPLYPERGRLFRCYRRTPRVPYIPPLLPMSSPSAAPAWCAIRCRGEAAWAISKARSCGIGDPAKAPAAAPASTSPAPLISSWSRTSSEARGALPTWRPSPTSSPGVDLRHEPFGLARRWWNQRFHPGMGGHRQRGGSGRQLHAVELAQIYASASWSEEASRGSGTSPPVRAVSDPTLRASWPPKAGTSAPGWAARSVTLASENLTRSTRNGWLASLQE